MRIIKLDHTTRDNILSDLLKRDPNNYDSYGAAVQEIVEAVKARKDEAVFAYTQKFDKVRIDKHTIRVTEA